jgi:hypothetical protein
MQEVGVEPFSWLSELPVSLRRPETKSNGK